MGPKDLTQVLRLLQTEKKDPNLLVGIENSDDGGVYKLTDDLAIVQSLDFFTPIVDNPYMFGQIAAANALSDVYAMGGTPKTVLNIVAYPIKTLGPEILAKILQGSNDKVKESGATVVGGHSIDDSEPKFGLSVTGIVHPDNIFKNIGARPGDVLILTKPIGMGILTTAIKRNLLPKEQINQVTNVMSTLNKYAAEKLRNYNPNAVTDVTGFGLLGHSFEMANGSNVSFIINYQNVPLLPRTKELAEKQVIPGGSKENHKWLKDAVEYGKGVLETDQLILSDAITSGGLLISLPREEASSFVHYLNSDLSIQANVIGEVVEKREKTIYVV